jgi:hypothetical protein
VVVVVVEIIRAEYEASLTKDPAATDAEPMMMMEENKTDAAHGRSTLRTQCNVDATSTISSINTTTAAEATATATAVTSPTTDENDPNRIAHSKKDGMVVKEQTCSSDPLRQ